MPKKKHEDKEEKGEEVSAEGGSSVVGVRFKPAVVTPLEFADLNTIKDKLNEVIAHLNK